MKNQWEIVWNPLSTGAYPPELTKGQRQGKFSVHGQQLILSSQQ